mmetsp:Transcript_50733/g.122367  ORF Transcript_50733/g.122367 Transcript_50733/m.122367 type:complete len:101 (+) Transcript_50733:949-1251(+)
MGNNATSTDVPAIPPATNAVTNDGSTAATASAGAFASAVALEFALELTVAAGAAVATDSDDDNAILSQREVMEVQCLVVSYYACLPSYIRSKFVISKLGL